MTPVCELINVGKSYGDHMVVDDLNLTITQGEMIAITGKSGSGKTTVLNIVGLLEKQDKGLVKLFGEKSPRIGSRGASSLRRTRIAYLFQNYALVAEETVNYNLDIPLTYSRKTRREKQQLKQAVLEKVGLDIPLTRKIYGLSGGEQQRIAIARILLKPSELILADEPTGSLDEGNRDTILGILKDLKHDGKTIIVVTHDPYIAAACDKTTNLERCAWQGQAGSPALLIQSG